MIRRLAIATAAAALLAAGCGGDGDEQPTLAALEKKFICPTCQTTLELSNAPVADRMRDFIRQRLAAGDSEEEIEEALVAQFGEAVLASPPKEGFNLLAWVLPLAGGAVAVAAVAVALRRWSRSRPAAGPAPAGAEPLDPELERRVDEELARFEG
jgi:cytochrome c-type biogenesis protein CcmH/NrfF